MTSNSTHKTPMQNDLKLNAQQVIRAALEN